MFQSSILALFLLVGCFQQGASQCTPQSGFTITFSECVTADSPGGCFSGLSFQTGSSCEQEKAKYTGCTTEKVFEVAYGSQLNVCISAGNNPGNDAVLAEKITDQCNSTMKDLLEGYCLDACPSADDLSKLTPLVTCLINNPKKLSGAELETYRPYDCLLEDPQFNKNNNDEPDICEINGDFSDFMGCTKLVTTVIDDIVNETTGASLGAGENCQDLFRGPYLETLCDKTFAQAVEIFCTPCADDDLSCQLILGLPALEFITIVSACGAVVLLAIAALIVWRRRRNKNKYKTGLVFINNGAMMPNGANNDTPMKKQLLEFYRKNNWKDPSGRKTAEQQVEYLFQNYDPPKIAKAIQTKYGYLPIGWESLLAQSGFSGSPMNSRDSSPYQLTRANSKITRQMSAPGSPTLSTPSRQMSSPPPPGMMNVGRQPSKTLNPKTLNLDDEDDTPF